MPAFEPNTYSEYCLNCANKHLGIAIKNLEEIQQEITRYDKLSTKARHKLQHNVYYQLAEAERHVTEGLSKPEVSNEIKKKLQSLAVKIVTARKILENNNLHIGSPKVQTKCSDNSCQTIINDTTFQVNDSINYLSNEIYPLTCGECEQSTKQLQELYNELNKPTTNKKINIRKELSHTDNDHPKKRQFVNIATSSFLKIPLPSRPAPIKKLKSVLKRQGKH